MQYEGLVTMYINELRKGEGLDNMEDETYCGGSLEELSLKCFPELIKSLRKEIPRSLAVISLFPDVKLR